MSFEIVNNKNDIPLSSEWIPAKNFNSCYQLRNAEGQRIGFDYKKKRYLMIAKQQKEFSNLVRIERITLGIMASIGVTLFCLTPLIFESIRQTIYKLFTKSAQTKRFAVLVPNTLTPNQAKIYCEILGQAKDFKKPRLIVKNFEQDLFLATNSLIENQLIKKIDSDSDEEIAVNSWRIVEKPIVEEPATVEEPTIIEKPNTYNPKEDQLLATRLLELTPAYLKNLSSEEFSIVEIEQKVPELSIYQNYSHHFDTQEKYIKLVLFKATITFLCQLEKDRIEQVLSQTRDRILDVPLWITRCKNYLNADGGSSSLDRFIGLERMYSKEEEACFKAVKKLEKLLFHPKA